MSNKYIIKEETLVATANALRDYSTQIGNETHVFDSSIVDADNNILIEEIQMIYYEEIDSNGSAIVGTSRGSFVPSGAGYAYNNTSDLVPVLYSDGYADVYYYVGVEMIGGAVHDKWRKIEDTSEDHYDEGTQYYTWDSDAKNYIYTNRVVTISSDLDTSISPSDFPSKIAQVYQHGANSAMNTNDATASVSDIREGQTAYVKGVKITGTMPDVESPDADISINEEGVISAKVTTTEGYLVGGTSVTTKKLSTVTGSTVTPTTTDQDVAAPGNYIVGSSIRVAGDSNLTAENIADGVSIFGVTGAHGQVVARTFNLDLAANSTTINLSYYNAKYWYLRVTSTSGTNVGRVDVIFKNGASNVATYSTITGADFMYTVGYLMLPDGTVYESDVTTIEIQTPVSEAQSSVEIPVRFTYAT